MKTFHQVGLLNCANCFLTQRWSATSDWLRRVSAFQQWDMLMHGFLVINNKKRNTDSAWKQRRSWLVSTKTRVMIHKCLWLDRNRIFPIPIFFVCGGWKDSPSSIENLTAQRLPERSIRTDFVHCGKVKNVPGLPQSFHSYSHNPRWNTADSLRMGPRVSNVGPLFQDHSDLARIPRALLVCINATSKASSRQTWWNLETGLARLHLPCLVANKTVSSQPTL